MTGRGEIKICGVTDAAAVAACVTAGVDWVGFVFHPASPRAIAPDAARALVAGLPSAIRTVGLFVGASDKRIASTLAACPLDVLQLYDTPARAAELRSRFGRETWLAHPIGHARELTEIPPAGSFDLLLIEARAPLQADTPGGHGTRLEWHALAGRLDGIRWMLAGGLDPWNVACAIAQSGAVRVDVSSGVERVRGVKDPDRIARFVASARTAFETSIRSAA